MNSAIANPVFSRTYGDLGGLEFEDNSLYITGVSDEERSRHTLAWESRCSEVTFAHVLTSADNEMTVSVGSQDILVQLRSFNSMSRFLGGHGCGTIYLDITGLEHSVWAPLLRVIRQLNGKAFCVYVEPGDYRPSSDPTEATIFDLSERIKGISPLPGFVSFGEPRDHDALFVPILGFEGARFTFALEAVQPDRRMIFPVIGVPGFRPEYPFYTYHGNRVPLEDTKAWQNVRYVPANCPFSVYYLLEQLARDSSCQFMKIAAIGTKPHALGAVLYYLDYPSTTELIYDHPIRKSGRTAGVSRMCVYDLSLLPRISTAVMET